jgi:beta-glucosidase
MEGGRALADLLLGRERPTGRLPFAIPTSADHLPAFDPDATAVEYGPLHGQALLDHLGVAAAYPYGFGLTYP